MRVQHQALALNWLTPSALNGPRTLVIGSFNPCNPNDQSGLDYYYGRKKNHFWKSIARNIGQNEAYFFDAESGLNRKIEIMSGNFCCLDAINSIDFECEDTEILNNYLNEKVFGEFFDSTIFTTTKRFQGVKIKQTRNYNNSILELLSETNTIQRVIHTMGNSRVSDFNNITPKERNVNPIGFREFIRQIIAICNEKRIYFDYNSFSPSQYAVNKGATPIQNLDNWLRNSLNLP